MTAKERYILKRLKILEFENFQIWERVKEKVKLELKAIGGHEKIIIQNSIQQLTFKGMVNSKKIISLKNIIMES